MSGRIHVALGHKLKFKAVRGADGKIGLQQPAGWVESDPNFSVLHDFVEFTHDASGMHCTTTVVDMFSPMMIGLNGAKDHSTGRLPAGGRVKVFSALRNHPDFRHLVIADRRVIAPSHGLDAGRFPQHYYDDYIDKVLHTYQNKNLVVRANAGTFTGPVRNQQLTFSGPAQAVSPHQPQRVGSPGSGSYRARPSGPNRPNSVWRDLRSRTRPRHRACGMRTSADELGLSATQGIHKKRFYSR
ncbi:beta-1,3-glucanase family protein [Streptomyces sp. NPDC046859]|uniref:beta-1,3-glucanase family protein n=1 Tax=Streptomyces sp. NPDC046859 TaxID=3155734 RepID=UPI003409C8D7